MPSRAMKKPSSHNIFRLENLMNRILTLQSMTPSISIDVIAPEGSTSSNSGCTCSTSSAVACYIGDELVAI